MDVEIVDVEMRVTDKEDRVMHASYAYLEAAIKEQFQNDDKVAARMLGALAQLSAGIGMLNASVEQDTAGMFTSRLLFQKIASTVSNLP